jgi:hypothetical protein
MPVPFFQQILSRGLRKVYRKNPEDFPEKELDIYGMILYVLFVRWMNAL